MYQVHTGTYVSLLATETDYSARSPEYTSTYALYVVPITTPDSSELEKIKKKWTGRHSEKKTKI